MIETMLGAIAKVLDGELFIFDDGYIIECNSPTLWMEAREGERKQWGGNQGAADFTKISGVKFLFDLEGNFETVQYHGSRE